jgi:hypothetical protein
MEAGAARLSSRQRRFGRTHSGRKVLAGAKRTIEMRVAATGGKMSSSPRRHGAESRRFSGCTDKFRSEPEVLTAEWVGKDSVANNKLSKKNPLFTTSFRIEDAKQSTVNFSHGHEGLLPPHVPRQQQILAHGYACSIGGCTRGATQALACLDVLGE